MTKVAWISVKVTLKDGADLDEVVKHFIDHIIYEEEHDDILDTQVMEIVQ